MSAKMTIKRFKNVVDIFNSELYFKEWSRYKVKNNHLEYMQGRMLSPKEEQEVLKLLGV